MGPADEHPAAARGGGPADAGSCLLSGRTTRGGATAQALGGLGAGVFTLWAIAGARTIVSGLDSRVNIAAGQGLYFALAMVATAVMFLAVGAFASQLAATRRQAASYAASVLGVSYAVRVIADAGLGLHGLIWASPLGWVEELQPLTAPQPLALLPIAAFTAVLAAAAVRLARRPRCRRGRGIRTGRAADRTCDAPGLADAGHPAGPARGGQLRGWRSRSPDCCSAGPARSAGGTVSGHRRAGALQAWRAGDRG